MHLKIVIRLATASHAQLQIVDGVKQMAALEAKEVAIVRIMIFKMCARLSGRPLQTFFLIGWEL